MYRVETDKAEYAIKKLNKTLMQNKEEFERINFAEKSIKNSRRKWNICSKSIGI